MKKFRILPFALVALTSCKKEPEPTFAREPPSQREEALAAADAAITIPVLDAGAASTATDASMWSHFSYQDETPLCAFGDWERWEKTKFLKDVPKSAVLKVDEHITFATYASECASVDCVNMPLMQCWVDMDGTNITVHSRYAGERRGDPSLCKSDCQEVTASCMTPKLAAGTYTVHYGARTWKIKVPSTLRPPCMKL